MSKIRILVLTSSTGGGHDARAEAFAEWCFQLYRHEVDVRIEQMLEKSSVVNRTGVNLYNRIQQGAPWMHKFSMRWSRCSAISIAAASRLAPATIARYCTNTGLTSSSVCTTVSTAAISARASDARGGKRALCHVLRRIFGWLGLLA